MLTTLSEKRLISVQEKKTLKRNNHNALIFLGENCPEVKELLDVGFSVDQIYGIDINKNNVLYAKEYYNLPNIYNTRFITFWNKVGYKLTYSYIHLDACGQATDFMLQQAINTIDCIESGGRLRVTYSGSLARLNRKRAECFLLEQVVQKINAASVGRLDLIKALNYTSSLSHKEPYLTAWFERK